MITISKRNLFFLLAITVIAVGITSFYLTQETHRVERENLENNLSGMISLYKNGEISFIDLSIISTFSWDRLYIFGPYTSLEVINKSLNGIWLRYWNTSIEYNEGIVLLVFTNKGKVVQYLEYPRGPQCDFAGAHNLNGFNRDDAHFIVDDKQRCLSLK
jgi:hypothetical protein